MKALIIGDVHAAYGNFYDLYNYIVGTLKESFDVVIQVGDLGFWPRWMSIQPWLPLHHKFMWIDGNHEDYLCMKNASGIGARWKQLLRCHVPRGTIWNGILFIGGAHSIDKACRTEGVDWFPEENISYAQQMKIVDEIDGYQKLGGNIHTVISHDCPTRMLYKLYPTRQRKGVTGNNKFLQHVLDETQPDNWFFGHHHQKKIGFYKDTQFRCVDMIRGKDVTEEDYVLYDLNNRSVLYD